MKSSYKIPGSDSRLMAADLTYSDKAIMPLVVYAHGINGFKDWGGMNLIADLFAKKGFAFLKFNFSYNGTTPENPGEFTDLDAFGHDSYLKRQKDLRSAIDYILQLHSLKFEINGIYLVGHSRGGTDVVLYAPYDNRINKIVTWSAPCEAKTPWAGWSESKIAEWKNKGVVYLENKRTAQHLPVYYQLYEEYLEYQRILDVERSSRLIHLPWLIAHGKKDESVPFSHAHQLNRWQPDAELLLIENTGHTFDRSHPWQQRTLPPASQKLVDATIDFLK